VGGRRGDDDGDVADGEQAGAVHGRQAVDGQVGGDGLGDRPQGLHRVGVRDVLQLAHAPARRRGRARAR
jgi:hypothetical protein